jgi:hypothetical protein
MTGIKSKICSQSRLAASAARAICAALVISTSSVSIAQPLPDSLAAAPDESPTMAVFAEGAQIYECKAGQGGGLSWVFREPIATLMVDGKTIGRHYAGPHWELDDGSVIRGRMTGRAPGLTPADIPLLRLAAMGHKGDGRLSNVTTIQRINTRGGALEGACDKPGAFQSVAYSTEYVFFAK